MSDDLRGIFAVRTAPDVEPVTGDHADELADVRTFTAPAAGGGWFTARTALVDLAARAANNGWQAAGPLLLPVLLLQAPFSWALLAAAAVAFGTSAAVSAAKSWLTWQVLPVPPLGFAANTAVSAATAFAGALAGALVAAEPFDLLTFGWSHALAAAAGAAVLAVGKAFVSAADQGGRASYNAVRAHLRRAAATPAPEHAAEHRAE